MKKRITLSGCLTKLILTLIVVLGFIWGFSLMFPRAYDVLEAKALGLDVGSEEIKVDSLPQKKTKNDSVKWKQVKDFEYAVKIEQDGNCYFVGTKVNGIPMKMLLDTGASNITISIIEYEFLRKQNLLNDTTISESECTIANGESQRCYSIKIAELSIGKEVIKNVDCLVMENPQASLLLGMNVLKKFGHIRIDYNRNLLILK